MKTIRHHSITLWTSIELYITYTDEEGQPREAMIEVSEATDEYMEAVDEAEALMRNPARLIDHIAAALNCQPEDIAIQEAEDASR